MYMEQIAKNRKPAVTPIMRLFREWQGLREIEKQVHDASPTGSDDNTKAATKALMAVERQMMAIPSASAEDWMLKMMAISCIGVYPPESEGHPIWAEAVEMITAEGQQEPEGAAA